MIISFPILLEDKGTRGRALFVPQVNSESRLAVNLFANLRKMLRDRFHTEGLSRDHGELFPLTFSPAIQCKRFSGECHLRRRTLKVDLPILTFTAFERPMTLIPHLGDLLLPLGSSIRDREALHEALTRYFLTIEKENPDSLPSEPLSLGPKASIHYLEVDVALAREIRSIQADSGFSHFGVSAVGDGYSELEKNGSSLGDLWPNGLTRAYQRDKEVGRLHRLLTENSRKPILLVGMRKAGKSTLFEEAVFRLIKERPESERHSYKEGFWRIHTNRLMAGMSLAGDWQKRLLVIAQHAEFWNHTLFFENLAALFHLGRSAGSRLCMTDLLRPWLEKQRFRFVAEATEETFARLQELDRSFCDLFEVIRVREVNRPTAIRILIGGIRDIEKRFPVKFDASVLPIAESLQRRFNHREGLVGGILDFLHDLATKATEDWSSTEKRDSFGRTPLGKQDILRHFSSLSGFSMDFLDATPKPREEIREALGKEWVGQEDALDILTDTIAVARAGIQDPAKPYGCFLFLGPTGVGKTECAKGLARYLYGDHDRLLRFDMNEFVSPGSAVRLSGSPDAPEGLLTSAVRQQPFAVVLFDEIEKAHPDVYDLLLQVLGEGRLSDALGRTVDFTNTIVLLTSNLGVREASRSSGFDGEQHSGQAYLDAARRFFRPEFYNRLDAVVPFRSLRRQEIAQINGRLLDAFFDRAGFLQRHASLRLTSEAKSFLTDKGYDPVFGARALKRVIEDTLANPVAASLAKHPPTAPVVIDVDVEDGRLHTEARVLKEAPLVKPWRPNIRKNQRLTFLDACADYMTDMQSRFSDPPPIISSEKTRQDNLLSPNSQTMLWATFFRYLSQDICDLRMDLEDERLRASIEGLRSATPRGRPVSDHFWSGGNSALKPWQALASASDINLFLDDLFRHKPDGLSDDFKKNFEWNRNDYESVNWDEYFHDIEGDGWFMRNHTRHRPNLLWIFRELLQLDLLTDPDCPETTWLMLYDKDLSDYFFALPQRWFPSFDEKLWGKDEFDDGYYREQIRDEMAYDVPSMCPSPQDLPRAVGDRSLGCQFFRGRNVEQFLRPFAGTYLQVNRSSGASRPLQCSLFQVNQEDKAEHVLKERLDADHPLGPFGPLTFIRRDRQVLDLRTGSEISSPRQLADYHLECSPSLKERLQHAGL